MNTYFLSLTSEKETTKELNMRVIDKFILIFLNSKTLDALIFAVLLLAGTCSAVPETHIAFKTLLTDHLFFSLLETL